MKVLAYERTYAGILAADHHLQVAGLVLGVVFGVGVERGEHGVDGRSYDLFGIERVDINHVEVLVNSVENLEHLRCLELVVAWSGACLGT